MSQNQQPESPQPVAEEEDLVGVATHDLLAVLVALPEDQRNAAYVEANSWQWPTALEQYKEGRFDQMGDREKMKDPAWKAMWTVIHQCTSEFGRSQGWWLIELKRTREEHAAWWANGQRPVSSANIESSDRETEKTMKIKVSKKWCQRSAEIEGESSVGAGATGPLMSGSERRLVLAGDEFRWSYGHPSGRRTTRKCHAFGKPKKNSKTIEVYWQGRVIKLDRADLTPTGRNVYGQNAVVRDRL